MQTIPQSRTLNRSDIIALGSKGKPWEFLPVAAKAIQLAPQDAAIGILTSANLASLGLVTLAGEVLDGLGGSAAGAPDAVHLRSILDRLPSDRVTAAERVGAASINLEAMEVRHRGVAALCRSAFKAWEAGLEEVDCFRAIDGNILRRPRGGKGPASCLSLADQRSQARAFAKSVAPATELMGRPVVIEGLSPPWVFAELMSATSSSFNGYLRRIMLVQGDPRELLDGLSFADLREALKDPRLEVYAGDSAAQVFHDALAARLDTVLVGQYIPVLATRTRVSPPIDQVLRSLEQRQAAAHREARARVEAIYRGRDGAWWAERFGSGEPLRVLIPTCRFSTFVRYASEDLAAGFEALGHRARVFMEPDGSSCLSSVGYLRQIEEFHPDLIVLVNYPRAAMGANFPANVPFVCWVQDAMPHLFDPRMGAAHGDMDFVAGVRLVELVSRFGYPAKRCLPFPVVVSRTKFERAPSRERAEQVEVVFATHHGETPDAMHERLVRDGGKDPILPRAMERLRPVAEEVARDVLAVGIKARVREAVVEAVGGLTGGQVPERAVSVLTHSYVLAMADRILRHEAAQWCASIAERRGWKFLLCGKNWDRHPTLAKFAAPALEHGDALRDSYHSATVHLHASYHGPLHQRVFECALAGGLPLCRLVWPTVSPVLPEALSALRRRLGAALGASAERIEGSCALVRVRDQPELREVAELIESAGLAPLPGWGIGDLCRVPLEAPPVADTDRDAWRLVTPMLAVSFRDEASLESLIERSAADPSWRADRSEEIASRVRAGLTHEALAAALVGFVGERLEAPDRARSTAPSAAGPTLVHP